jgi:transcriptional regulator GlxA family with amidase domain
MAIVTWNELALPIRFNRKPRSITHMKTLRVGLLLTPCFTLNALANFVDILRLAADDGDGSRPIQCQWHIMSTTGKSIGASCGLQVAPTAWLIEPNALDHIVVIGGLLRRGPTIDSATREYLIKASLTNTGLIGICTGAFVLCRLGLMNKKRCCISWYHYRDFLDEFDDIEPLANQLYIVDGTRITSPGGVGAALVAAHLVETHLGHSLAQKALHIMQIDKTRPAAMLQPAPPLSLECDEASVSSALLFMEQNLSPPLSISSIARRVNLSTRSLQRSFRKQFGHGPKTIYLQLRLKHALWMLRAKVPLIEAATETGFATASAFSAAFKREHGHTPSAARCRWLASTNTTLTSRLESTRRIFEEPNHRF